MLVRRRRRRAGHSLIRTHYIYYYARPRQILIRLAVICVQSAKNEPHKTIKNARPYAHYIVVRPSLPGTAAVFRRSKSKIVQNNIIVIVIPIMLTIIERHFRYAGLM